MASDRFVDRAEIAFLMGVDVRTITNYVKKHPDFPSRVRGSTRARSPCSAVSRGSAIARWPTRSRASRREAERRRG
jgi:hypothetical protein